MKKPIIFIVVGVVVVAGMVVAGVLIWQSQTTPTDQASTKPSFAFNSAKAPGWWSGGNNWPDINDFTGDQVTAAELPVADIMITKGSQEKPGNCFVMAFYQNGAINIPETLEKRRSGMVPADKSSDILTQVAAPLRTMLTPEGTKEFQYYQYDLDLPQVQRGNAFGFIPLSNGYVEVRGICSVADELPTTHEALTALSLQP